MPSNSMLLGFFSFDSELRQVETIPNISRVSGQGLTALSRDLCRVYGLQTGGALSFRVCSGAVGGSQDSTMPMTGLV